MKKDICRSGILVLMLLTVFPAASVETITIGANDGIVWEGLPFNESLEGHMDNSMLSTQYGLLSISINQLRCMLYTRLREIGGYYAYPLNDSHSVGIIPRATGVAKYTRANDSVANVHETLTGTIGLPESKGKTSAGATIYTSVGRAWCLAPDTNDSNLFYNENGNRTATLSGSWVIVANGSQQSEEITIPPMYFGSYSASGSGDRYTTIFPERIRLRISTLKCTVNTPVSIDFGSIQRNTKTGTELAFVSNPFVTSCTQDDKHKIAANINVQFRSLTGLDSNKSTRLALNQGGGWITGEINGVTGSGNCESDSGIPFDNSLLKIGSIRNSETSKNFNHNVTWRLCSGGASLPEGQVDASTEMLVTFN